MCGNYRRGLDWWMDLLITYIHNSELQVITAPSLLSIIRKWLQHPLSIFQACYVVISRSLATAANSGNSSASRAHIRYSQPPVRKSNLNWQLISPIVLIVISRHKPHRKHRSSIVAFVPIAAGTCLRAVAQKRSRSTPQKTSFFYCRVRVCCGL
jgi:hypothetical protein